jgi:ABC-type microcin C transport system duplicated ATPase subunit YejF
MLYVTHDWNEVEAICGEALIMRSHGQVAEAGLSLESAFNRMLCSAALLLGGM